MDLNNLPLWLLPTLLITLILILLPEIGMRALVLRYREVRRRTLIEDALKLIHASEIAGDEASVHRIGLLLEIKEARWRWLQEEMEALQLIENEGEIVRLTSNGRTSALHILRAHRLWEQFLSDQTGYGEADWHDQADRFEHRITPAQADELAAQLSHPTHDPHGDPIPSSEGDLLIQATSPITEAELDLPLRIVHLEDEPEEAYSQLIAEGLYPGMDVRLLEVAPDRIRFWGGEEEHILAPIIASNISVRPLRTDETSSLTYGVRLSELDLGQRGRVLGISTKCRGLERRRLYDLGILPGTVIEAEFASPGGDPKAFRIRDAIIGLRKDQSDLISVTRLPEVA